MKAAIVIGNNYSYNAEDFKNAYVIGVDKGALFCYSNNINMDVAIGDFDSINKESLSAIKATNKIIKLNPIKDETDTMAALNLVSDYNEIVIYGGIKGDRIEHFYANLLLLKKYSQIKMIDDNSLIFTTDKDISFSKSNYKYYSIFSLDDDTILSTSGFKYNLTDFNLLTENPLGISNELIEDVGNVFVKKGRILIICSKADNV